jgi:hypothetical protein
MRRGTSILLIICLITLQGLPFVSSIKYSDSLKTLQQSTSPLVFSTYFDSAWSNPPIFSIADMADYGRDIAIDESGSIYIAGEISFGFLTKITSLNPYQGYYKDIVVNDDLVAIALDSSNNVIIAMEDYGDISIAKVDPVSGHEMFRYHLNGTAWDMVTDIAVDSQDNIYITGYTSSEDFPVVNPLFEKNIGQDVFLTILDSNGHNLLFSSYLGGSLHDQALSIDLDSANNIYIAGMTASTDFPVSNAVDSSYNHNHDGFVVEINSDWDDILFSTYIGGTGEDYIDSICVYDINEIAACGFTSSNNFPTINNLSAPLDQENAFVFKMDTSSPDLSFSTLFGGNRRDEAIDLSVDTMGQIYVTGETVSGDFPTLLTQVSNASDGDRSIFVSKFNISNNLSYSVIVGGSSSDFVHHMVIDDYGGVLAVGESFSTDFPTLNAPYVENQGQTDVVVFKIVDLTDSDGDSINDYTESLYKTNRFKVDSDDDQLPDNYEVKNGLNPIVYDSNLDEDSDGLSNLVEYQIGTDCNNVDSDSDSYSDWFEYSFGFDPLDPTVTLYEAIIGNPLLIPSIVGLVTVLIIGFFYNKRRVRAVLTKQRQKEMSETKQAMDELRNSESQEDTN